MYHCGGKVKAGRGRGRGGRLAKKSGKVSATSVSDTSAATNMLSVSTTVGVTSTTTATSKASTTSSTSSSFPARPPTSAAASTASAASSTSVMASYFYGRGKKSIKKQVELPLQQSPSPPPPPMTPPMPLPTVPTLPSSPKKQLRETESETLSSSLPHEIDFECDAPLSPTTAESDMLYSLTPHEFQHDLEKGQEGCTVRSRTGSSSLFSSAPNSPSPSVIVEEEFCDDTDLVPCTPAKSSSTSSPSVTVVASATASTAAVVSALNRDEQGQGAASRRSKVWKYFQTMEAGGFFAKCKLCGKQVSRGKKLGHLSNAGMNLHLKNYHHSTLLRAEAEKDGSAESIIIEDSDCSSGGTSSSTLALTQGPTNRVQPTNRPRPLVPLRSQTQSCSESSSSQGHQPTLDCFVGFSSKGMSKQQANKITRLIGQFIAVGGASFRMIEGEPFKQLMHALAPRYVVPARTTFSRKIIPALYRSCVAALKEKMGKAEGQTIHLTTDLWTAPSGQHAFLSLTAHWWEATVPVGGVKTSSGSSSAAEDQLGYQAFLLHTEVRDDKHTSANILRAIRLMLANWFGEQAVSNVSVGFIVTDGGSNMVKALQDGSFVGVRCSAHILHLVVKGAIPTEKHNKIPQILELCRKIAGHFHRSVGASQLLREEQERSGLPIHRLKQDVSTRWNYTLEMLERIFEQRTAIHNLSSRHSIGIDDYTLGRDDWCIIGQLVSVLKPFRNVTENLSHSSASLGQVIPLFTYLIDKMGSFLENTEPLCGSPLHADVVSFIRKLQDNLKDRKDERVRKSPELMLASMCDPRIKGKLALRDNKLSYWKEKLIERVRNLQRQRCMPGEPGLEDSPAMSAIPKPGTITQEKMSEARACWVEALDSLVDAGQSAGNREESSASEMVRAYLYEAPLLPTEEPLTYWDGKKSVWPGLCLVAQQLLSCPPTTVQSERVFSITGNILNPHRSQLTPHLMEQITFLKFNLPKLGYPNLNL